MSRVGTRVVLPLTSSYDLIVIGAGINGAAIAREFSLQGFKLLLLDRADLACGASSASTRLIHGGLRYLEHGELSLVRESLLERERLLSLAPHLVEPLALCLPLYAGARRGPWKIRAGLWLYETLFRSAVLPRHRMLTPAALRECMPGLEAAGLVAGAMYFDAQAVFPERLVVENVVDAVAHGAALETYCEAQPHVVDGVVRGVRWRDAAGRAGSAEASLVVNAAGPWVDEVRVQLHAPPLIGGSKGSHLVLTRFPGAPDAALYCEAAADGRPFFVIPWNGLLLVGTTDVRFDADPGTAHMERAEYDYLLAETARLFPQAGDLADFVLYTQSGVRPLPYHERGDVGAVTRRHLIRRERGARGLYSVVGGKLTTHRALAEDVLRRLRGVLGAPDAASRTRTRPLPGAQSVDARAALMAELDGRFGPTQALRLWHLYGGRAAALLALAEQTPELGETLDGESRVLTAELVHAIEAEWARGLDDILLRRCMAGLDADCGLGAAAAGAERLARLGVWDRLRARNELEQYRVRVRRRRAPAAVEIGGTLR